MLKKIKKIHDLFLNFRKINEFYPPPDSQGCNPCTEMPDCTRPVKSGIYHAEGLIIHKYSDRIDSLQLRAELHFPTFWSNLVNFGRSSVEMWETSILAASAAFEIKINVREYSVCKNARSGIYRAWCWCMARFRQIYRKIVLCSKRLRWPKRFPLRCHLRKIQTTGKYVYLNVRISGHYRLLVHDAYSVNFCRLDAIIWVQ